MLDRVARKGTKTPFGKSEREFYDIGFLWRIAWRGIRLIALVRYGNVKTCNKLTYTLIFPYDGMGNYFLR